MSFYHVLPSNSSPDTFPSNNASYYSTPLIKPHDFSGNWEVAITNLTHSNCIYTFNNETAKWSLKQKDLTKIDQPTLFKLSKPKKDDVDAVLMTLAIEIKELCKNIVHMTVRSDDKKGKYVSWKVNRNDIIVRLNPELAQVLKLDSDVITSHDRYDCNYWPITDSKLKLKEDPYIVLIPTSSLIREIVVKKPQEEIKPTELLERFNTLVRYADKSLARLELHHGTHFQFHRLDSKYIIVLSKHLHVALRHRVAGFFHDREHRFLSYYFAEQFQNQWSVYIYPSNPIFFNGVITKDITLDRKLFSSSHQVITYLNNKFNGLDVTFSYNDNGIISFKILNDNVAVEFDADVQDILGLDKMRYEGRNTFTASAKLSLTRRINYLYVYSNISAMIRIGDTESPLLTVVPFNPKPCKVLSEKTFRYPMYIPLTNNRLSQIDIGIYDDAGKLVPFDNNAIRLHFRKQS